MSLKVSQNVIFKSRIASNVYKSLDSDVDGIAFAQIEKSLSLMLASCPNLSKLFKV